MKTSTAATRTVCCNLKKTTVDNQLKLLISLYEEEKIRLQKLIGECLAETDYLMAHYHSEALYQLNRRLQTLHNIDDNLYDEKSYKLNKIRGLEKNIATETSDFMKECYSKDILKAKEELKKLNEIPTQQTQSKDLSLLDEALQGLIQKKIKNLKLILKKEDNLFLGFSYSNKILKVTLPYVKQHIRKWTLYDNNINSFKYLGFELTENESKLTLKLSGNKHDILVKLKIILSKIVFEIFYFKEFDNGSYIQFTEKANR